MTLGADAIGGEEVEIEMNKIAKGYRYGSTIIPVTDADENAMKIESTKCLKLIGELIILKFNLVRH